MSDLNYALRTLARTPGFTVAAILTLSIGIGATTAIYSVVNAVLLQPLPYPDSDRLFRVVENVAPFRAGFSWTQRGPNNVEFLEWRSRARTLDATAATIGMGQRLVRTPRGIAGLWGTMVSGNTLELLGARAMIGRTLNEGDDASADVVVLSYDTWRRHFESDPDMLGRAIEFRAGGISQSAPRVLTVVGVMPRIVRIRRRLPDADRGRSEEALRRHHAGAARSRRDDRGGHAGSERDRIGGAPASPRGCAGPAGPSLRAGRHEGPTREAGAACAARADGAVAVVLLIVCANVANLIAGARHDAATRDGGAGRGWREPRPPRFE